MITLYITSTEEFAGKTSLAIGLGKHLEREGYIVGYMRALTTRVQQMEDREVAQDAEFVRQRLCFGTGPVRIVFFSKVLRERYLGPIVIAHPREMGQQQVHAWL